MTYEVVVVITSAICGLTVLQYYRKRGRRRWRVLWLWFAGVCWWCTGMYIYFINNNIPPVDRSVPARIYISILFVSLSLILHLSSNAQNDEYHSG